MNAGGDPRRGADSSVEGMFVVRLSCAIGLALLPVLAGCTSAAPGQIDFTELPGTIELNQGPLVDAPSGGGGHGTLMFHKQLYSFAIGGLGIDGSAVAIIQTEGEAYRLKDISMFAGTYRKVPAGAPLPAQAGAGLWLSNEHGALMRLLTPPGGRMPDIDGDAVLVSLQ